MSNDYLLLVDMVVLLFTFSSFVCRAWPKGSTNTMLAQVKLSKQLVKS